MEAKREEGRIAVKRKTVIFDAVLGAAVCIYVLAFFFLPIKGGLLAEINAQTPPEDESISDFMKIGSTDINSASKEELSELPGIGEALSEGIIAYREKNGPFDTEERLMDVPKIGEKRYAALKKYIYCG